MRVLMLSSSYPLAPGDWRGGFVRELGQALMAAGHAVEVAVPRPDPSTGWTPPPHDEDGPFVAWLPSLLPGNTRAFHGAGIEANLAASPLLALGVPRVLASFALEASIRTLFADCIVAHWVLPMGAVGAALSAASGRPLVIVAHSAPPAFLLRGPGRAALRALVRRTRAVACVSAAIAAAFEEAIGPDPRIETLALGVAPRPAVEPAGREGALRVLFVGRLVRLKGADLLVRAAARLPGLELTVIGDGPEAGPLRALARDLGVRVAFRGEVTHPEARAAMPAHDLLVLPSRRGRFGREEGMPRVVAEAWAAGVPVAASSTGGLAEAARTGGGVLLFAPDDEDALVRTLDAFRCDPQLRSRLRAEAREAGVRRSWDALGPRWVRLIERCAGR